MASHTKLEWRRDGTLVYALMSENTGVSRTGLKNRFWFKVYGDKDCPADELEANARLARAAPLLLEALTSSLEDWQDGYRLSEVPATKELVNTALGVATGLTDEGYGGTGGAQQQPKTDNLSDLAAQLLAALDDGNPRRAKVRQAIFELPGGAG